MMLKFNMNMNMNHWLRYYHTIKYLKPIQVYSQIRQRFRRLTPKKNRIVIQTMQTKLPQIRKRTSRRWQQIVTKKDCFHAATNEIECLQMKADITSPTIWHDDKHHSRLWLYHLHYCHYLHAMPPFAAESLMLRWIKENPPCSGIGYEPYPISLRVVNWIKWLLGERKPNENTHWSTIHFSLVQQITHLLQHLEFHILGNHLFANAKALVFAGFYFERNRWLQRGLQLLSTQIKEQILLDGGHFELSPMYHAIILEDMLDVIQLCHIYNDHYPETWQKTINHMLQWLHTMCHPDGEFALFNDTSLNVAATYQELRHYSQQLACIQHDHWVADANPQYLADSGYCRIQYRDMTLIADVAPVGAAYQPGHAHADTLSFELSIAAQRVFVNSGTSTYAESQKRYQERSTSAHNTVVINDHNSSDVWKSFRVGQRATVHDIELRDDTDGDAIEDGDGIALQATHDGYMQRHQVLHTRIWQFMNNALHIADIITGRGTHRIAVHFHLHPAITPIQVSEHEVLLRLQTKNIARLTQHTQNAQLHISPATYHPRLNTTLATQKIILRTTAKVPLTLTTIITRLEK